jgi:hypothetical protein
MDNETKETVLKVTEFNNEEKAKALKNLHVVFIVAMIFLIVLIATQFIDGLNDHLRNFLTGMSMGIGLGMTIVGAILTSKYAKDIREFKMRLLGKNKT